jgi:hypothetical protein
MDEEFSLVGAAEIVVVVVVKDEDAGRLEEERVDQEVVVGLDTEVVVETLPVVSVCIGSAVAVVGAGCPSR